MSGAPLTRYRCVMLRRSGASEIRVIRAENEGSARAQLAAMGREPVSVEAIGPSLFDSLGERLASAGWRLPRWRPAWPRDIWWPVLLILATIPISTALGAWTIAGFTHWRAYSLSHHAAPALAAYARTAAIERARPQVEAVMAVPSLTSLVARLSAALPADAGLGGMMLDEAGALTIEVETADPDRLRTALAGDPLLGSLRETGQTRTDGGTIRVVLMGRIR